MSSSSIPDASESARHRLWERFRAARPFGLLVLLVVAVYWPVHAYEFVNWDDPWYVVDNPYLRSWHPSNLWDIATQVINRNYSPVVIYSLLVEYSLFGLEPAGYHLVNVGLHALNACLVFVLVRQVSGSHTIGLWTAAVFAVHPVQIEAVAWVSSIKGLLVSAFILGHLICWLRPERTGRQEFLGLVFFVLALFSKALTVVVPAIVLSYDVLVCRKKFSEALARQFVPGMLSVWMLATTMGAQASSLGGTRAHLELNKLEIIAVDAVILSKYVAHSLLPVGLSVMYDPPIHGIGLFIAATALCWMAAGWLAWSVRQSHPLITFAAVNWLLLLLPVLNLTPITTLINDRYLYLPLVPFFALLFGLLRSRLYGSRLVFPQRTGSAVAMYATSFASASTLVSNSTGKSGGTPENATPGQTVPAGRTAWRVGWLAGPALATIGLAMASKAHLPVWQNDRALWEHTMTRAASLPVVRIQYAMMLHNSGRDADAVDVLQRTLVELQPDDLDRERIRDKIAEWSENDRLHDQSANRNSLESSLTR
ncbi:MAG: hypothetical protein ACYTGL_06315 [Planctomycetota bacterium]|jgi:hypothetical protein